MAIKYKTIRQATPGKQGGGTYRYYARACEREKKEIKYLAKIIAQRSSLSESDVKAVLDELTSVVPRLLLDNNTVQLGDFGTLSLHLNSRGEATTEDVSWRSIKDVKVQFRAGLELKKQIKEEIHFQREQ
ncbi:hypothetical protein DMA11_16275 [Marinilabiliaceae bacterium JC017]|nr:hypothetical protein DMA11_16275 [Marinilabiliaceae bacterium JC017]